MTDSGEPRASTSTTSVPGWYPDPVAAGLERWWDGAQWGASQRPKLLAPPVPTPPVAPTTPRSRDPLWRSQKVLALVLGLAVIVAVTSGVLIVRTGLGALTAPTFATPGTVTRELDVGTYSVFEHTGRTTQAGPVTVSQTNGGVLRVSDVQVVDRDGRSLGVTVPSIDETVTRGSAIYWSMASFTVERAGRYTVDVGGPTSEVFVSRKLLDGSARPMAVMLIAGFVGCVSAISLFTIVLVKASRRRRAHA